QSLCTLFFCVSDSPATTAISPLSLHDALPICVIWRHAGGDERRRCVTARDELLDRPEIRFSAAHGVRRRGATVVDEQEQGGGALDRKSTRLNSSHQISSYAVFCLKKKKHNKTT